MLTVKQAIEQRRSIRKFKSDIVSQKIILDLLESARLAPSGGNAQPWRFKIVTNQSTKTQLATAAHNQQFIATAPVVIICCASIKEYFKNMALSLQDLDKENVIDKQVIALLKSRTEKTQTLPIEQLNNIVSFHTAIAIEHIVLRALDYGLGTCWVKLIDVAAIKKIFAWNDDLHVVALLPLGYPAESPSMRKRLALEEIIL